MNYVSGKEMSERLNNIVITNFMTDEFTHACLYCRNHMEKEAELIESLIDQYEFHLKAFVNITFKMIGHKDQLDQLFLLCDPWVVFSFNNAYRIAVNNLGGKEKSIHFAQPVNDSVFFRKYALFEVY